jgi:peptidoglycan/LPS O-acetylase OafA/YrhL
MTRVSATELPGKPGRRRLAELESLRGIAAVVVFLHHFLLATAPHLHGRNFPDDPIALVRTPLFAFVNGSAAVAVFFVLSGFVLTFHAIEGRDWKQILVGVLKQWPRLALLVVAVNVVSAIFFMLGFYQNSTWFNLHSYTAAGGLENATSIMGGALAEGLFWTFINGKAHFNAALWTMHYELFGSFAAYATGLLFIFQRSFFRSMAMAVIAVLLTATLTGEGGVYYAMLVAGASIARIYLERDALARALTFMDPWWSTIVIAVIGLSIVLFGFDGYSKPVGFYAFLAPFALRQAEPLIHGVAAVAIVVVVLFCDPVRRRLVGSAASLLGQLSFPVYLVHLPILFGFVAPIHSALADRFGSAIAFPLAFVLFVILTLIAAYPLARLDAWWVRKLRALAAAMQQQKNQQLGNAASRFVDIGDGTKPSGSQ